jgi:hypothetical protein
MVDIRNIAFSAKKLVIGLDKHNNFCYNKHIRNNTTKEK